MVKTYEVEFSVYVTLTIKNDDVLARVTDDPAWKHRFYTNWTKATAIAHLAKELGLNGLTLDKLDGWADCDPKDVEVETPVIEWESVEGIRGTP